MMKENSSSAKSTQARGLLERIGAAGPGTRAVFIKDDPEGKGRKYYKALKSAMSGQGYRTMDLPEIRCLDGKSPLINHGTRTGERLLSEAMDTVSLLSRHVGDEPFLLALRSIGAWDRHAAMVVELLLEAGGCGLGAVPAGACGMRGIVLALETEGENSPLIGEILRHPAAVRLQAPDDYAPQTGIKSFDGKALRALRLCQLAYLPLTVAEIEKLEGPSTWIDVRRSGMDLFIKGEGAEKIVRLSDGMSPYLTDVSTLPPATLAEYHGRLLAVFEARRDGESVTAARLHHAVHARNAQAVDRWVEAGVRVLLAAGKADEAEQILRHGILVVAGDGALHARESAMRRTLAGIYAEASQPLQAFETLCVRDARRLSLEEWYDIARWALDAGRPKAASQAIERALNGLYQDPRQLVRFKVLQCEQAYLEGDYAQCLHRCLMLKSDGLLEGLDRVTLQNVEGKIHLAQGQFRKAEAVFRSNLKLSHALHAQREEVIATINLGVCAMWQGYFPAARRWLEKAAAASDRLHYHREQALALANMAVIHHLEKNYRKAIREYQRALGILKVLDCRDVFARFALDIGELFVELGDPAEARRMLAAALQRITDMQDSHVAGDALALSGRINHAAGNFADALKDFEAAEAHFRRIEAWRLLAGASLWRAKTLLELMRPDDAQEALREAADRIGEDEKLRARLALCRARIRTERGAADDGPFEEALAAFGKARDREGELECLVHHARVMMLRGERGRAGELLRRASGVRNLIRCTVPEENLPGFDGTTLSRRLASLLSTASAGEEAADGKRGARKTRDAGGPARRTAGGGSAARQSSAAAGTAPDGAFYLRLLLEENVGLGEFKKRIEKRCVSQALAMSNWNVSRASELLGMKRPRLSQIVNQYRLKKGIKS